MRFSSSTHQHRLHRTSNDMADAISEELNEKCTVEIKMNTSTPLLTALSSDCSLPPVLKRFDTLTLVQSPSSRYQFKGANKHEADVLQSCSEENKSFRQRLHEPFNVESTSPMCASRIVRRGHRKKSSMVSDEEFQVADFDKSSGKDVKSCQKLEKASRTEMRFKEKEQELLKEDNKTFQRRTERWSSNRRSLCTVQMKTVRKYKRRIQKK